MTEKSFGDLKPDSAIGIFDSGIGGITVMKQIIKLLPEEKLIYFADSARFPYGTKSASTVTKFASDIVRFLLHKEIKMIVVACNSASALALDTIKGEFQIPMVGVIEPGAQAAVESTKTGRVGVIGTNATIQSQAYYEAIKRIDPQIEVFQHACPIFVSMVEEGWVDKEVTRLAVREYLGPLKEKDIDVLLLGCTHYPMLKKVISEYMGPGVKLVDCGSSCAGKIERTLSDLDLKNSFSDSGGRKYFVTDMPERFKQLGEQFLGLEINNIEIVDTIGE
jgi:glutamate racemase